MSLFVGCLIAACLWVTICVWEYRRILRENRRSEVEPEVGDGWWEWPERPSQR